MKSAAHSRDTSDPLSTMIEALGLEVAAIKKSGGSISIELMAGTFVALTGGQYLYKFPLTEELLFRMCVL